MSLSKNKNVIFLLSYLLLVFYIVFLTPNRLSHENNNKLGKYNLSPLITKKISSSNYKSVYDLINSSYGDLIGNILMFVPFPILIINANRKFNLLLIMVIMLLSSISTELIQYFLNLGYADIDDVIMNTIGTVLGLICVAITINLSKEKESKVF